MLINRLAIGCCIIELHLEDNGHLAMSWPFDILHNGRRQRFNCRFHFCFRRISVGAGVGSPHCCCCWSCCCSCCGVIVNHCIGASSTCSLGFHFSSYVAFCESPFKPHTWSNDTMQLLLLLMLRQPLLQLLLLLLLSMR